MKKIFGFLGVAMLMSLAGCSNDDFLDGTQAGGGTGVETKGDLFMTLNVSQVSSIGTRTATPNQGYEVGKDYENKISSALVILATPNADKNGYTIKFVSSNIPSGDVSGNASSGAADGSHGPNNPSDADKVTGSNGNNMDIEVDKTHTNTYITSFTLNRENVLADIEANGVDASSDVIEGGTSNHEGKKLEYYIFVVGNPTNDIILAATPTDQKPVPDLQQLITAANNKAVIEENDNESGNAFWKKNNFLMSSAQPAKHTIYADEIPEGTHTTKAEAYPLGKVYIQRAMSRFDLAIDNNHIEFEGAGDTNAEGTGEGVNNVNIKFDAVAMVNMAKTAYLFKVMSLTEPTKTAGAEYPTKFGDERESTFESWWTVTPHQTTDGTLQGTGNYFTPLFPGFKFGGTTSGATLDPTKSTATQEDTSLKSFFVNANEYQVISQSWPEDNTFEHEGHNPGQGNYNIWRYAMENTNPYFAANQVNGNSTGIIFRAKLTETNADPENPKIPTEYEEGDKTAHVGQAIYAYNNVILGTAEQLFKYATEPKAVEDGVYEAVNSIYWEIIQPKIDANKDSAKESGWRDGLTENDWWIKTETISDGEPGPGQEQAGGTIRTTYYHGDLSELDAALVKKGFNIYRPTPSDETEAATPIYYCYYIYWNRHNDNGQNTVMGTMEFATVRNNVYKLSVNKVLRLGHPGDHNDDPYPPKPGTPDEKDEFWLEVECHILPWEVRVNNIEF